MTADQLAALEDLRQVLAQAPQLDVAFWSAPKPALVQDWCVLTEPVENAIAELCKPGGVECWRDVDPRIGGYSYVCTLPAGHPGPCIGWSHALSAVHAKDRLHYRTGLGALPVKPYEQEAQS